MNLHIPKTEFIGIIERAILCDKDEITLRTRAMKEQPVSNNWYFHNSHQIVLCRCRLNKLELMLQFLPDTQVIEIPYTELQELLKY